MYCFFFYSIEVAAIYLFHLFIFFYFVTNVVQVTWFIVFRVIANDKWMDIVVIIFYLFIYILNFFLSPRYNSQLNVIKVHESHCIPVASQSIKLVWAFI